jgi:hypothetical protein
MGSPGLLVGVSSLQSAVFRPAPDFLAAPAAGASSGSVLLLFMGPGWGGGGPQHQLPPPAQTGWEEGEGRDRDTAWEGATVLGRRAGWGQAQSRTPPQTQ